MVLLIEADIFERLTMTVERTDRDAYEMVMRMGLRARTAGTVEAHGMDAGRPEEGAERPATAQQREEENRAPKGMTMSKWRVVRTCPLLMVMDCR